MTDLWLPPSLTVELPIQADIDALRAVSAEADEAGELRPEQIELIHRRQWLRMLAPRSVGGAELPLPQAVRLEEAVSGADGSCGWVVTLCAGAGWFAGFMPPHFAREIIATPNVCLGGSGAPSGTAQRDGEGWLLNGHWHHATGSQLATHFTFNAQLQEGGLPVLDAQGKPRTRAFVVPASCVTVDMSSWSSIGLRGSTSRSFSVDGVRMTSDHAFDIDASKATSPGPLSRFPFEPLALATLGACVLGLARRFVTLAEPLTNRPIPRLNGASTTAQAAWCAGAEALDGSRNHFYAELDRGWDSVAHGEGLDPEREQRLGEAAHSLVRCAREAVDTLYPYCGLRAADPRTEINRVWRDFHTATQHSIWLR